MEKCMINESKRDDLLLQYVELLNNNGINVNLGQVKSKLLNKFVVEGNIHNLSLRSNYYLAGVAKYYFNGSLTKNKDLSLLKRESWEGQDVSDNWDVNICTKVNALINVLRNAYIDSIGTQMVEPEDFGELPIKDLLRKYNKEINKELGIKKTKKKEAEIDTSDTVGNGYTFEIMYSYEDCEKYNIPTSPGAWCITYGKQHYNSYVSMLDIHYVIFRMNGWENVQRPQDPLESPGFTREKPQDLYGNSLIAVLQSNQSPEPIYITSRWNHGYEVSCEADHAYTKEEFEKITGVSDEDLTRIYQIWKMNKNAGKRNSVNKKEELFVLKSLKYLQMRINAGENPEKLFDTINHVFGSTKINKGTFCCSAKISETTMAANERYVYFIYDNGKIVFESVTTSTSVYKLIKDFGLTLTFDKDKNSIYSFQKHKMVSVEGVSVFKRIPTNYQFTETNGNISYFTVNQGKFDAALIDTSTMEPLKLPNGAFWFNFMDSNIPSWNYGRSNQISCKVYEQAEGLCFDIIYDMSSCEKYFYNAISKKFFEIPVPEFVESIYSDRETVSSEGMVPMFAESYKYSGIPFKDGIIPIEFAKPSSYGLSRGNLYSYGEASKTQFFQNGKPMTINGNKWFGKLKALSYVNLICINSNNTYILCDYSLRKMLCDENGKVIEFRNIDETQNMLSLSIGQRTEIKSNIMIYDIKNNSFITNIFNQDNIQNDCVFNGIFDYFYGSQHISGYGFSLINPKIPRNKIPSSCVMRTEIFDGKTTHILDIPEQVMLQMGGRKLATWKDTNTTQNTNTVKIDNNDLKQMVSEAINKLLGFYLK